MVSLGRHTMALLVMLIGLSWLRLVTNSRLRELFDFR